MKKTILLIEDDPAIIDITMEMIEMFGYEIYQAGNMNDSITIFEKYKEKIGLIIFDMNLEDTTGIEVFSKFKSLGGDFVAILASGDLLSNDVDKFKKEGFKEVISKPYSIMDLKNMLNSYL